MMLRSSLFFLLLLAAQALFAQSVKNFSPAPPAEAGFSEARLSHIDNMLEEHVRNQSIPGAVAIFVRHGNIVYYKAFGFSNYAHKASITKDYCHYIVTLH